MSSLLAIDPGLGSTGWAYWDKIGYEKITPPDAFGLITPRDHGENSDGWWGRANNRSDDLFSCIRTVVKGDVDLLKVFCEMPRFFSGNAGGHAAAETGSIMKLAYLVGSYARSFRMAGASFTIVPVMEWKGQLPKEVVNKRIVQLLGEKACTNFRRDAWDAIGIGLHVKGVFK